eukprot:2559342-Rhodomonas_salina.2
MLRVPRYRPAPYPVVISGTGVGYSYAPGGRYALGVQSLVLTACACARCVCRRGSRWGRRGRKTGTDRVDLYWRPRPVRRLELNDWMKTKTKSLKSKALLNRETRKVWGSAS